MASLFLLELDRDLCDYHCYHRMLVRADNEDEARDIAAKFAVSGNASFGCDNPRGFEVEHQKPGQSQPDNSNFKYTDMYGFDETCYNPWLDTERSFCKEITTNGLHDIIIYDHGGA